MLQLLALSLPTHEVCHRTAEEEVMQSVNKTILFGYIFELWSPGRSPWLKPGRAERIKSSSYE